MENDDIWRRYMGGEHAKHLRVVECMNSPLQQQIDVRKARLAEIQADNERLLERIAELEKNGAGAGMRVDQQQPGAGMETETLSIVKELRAEVATLEKRMLRLKQVGRLLWLCLSRARADCALLRRPSTARRPSSAAKCRRCSASSSTGTTRAAWSSSRRTRAARRAQNSASAPTPTTWAQ